MIKIFLIFSLFFNILKSTFLYKIGNRGHYCPGSLKIVLSFTWEPFGRLNRIPKGIKHRFLLNILTKNIIKAIKIQSKKFFFIDLPPFSRCIYIEQIISSFVYFNNKFLITWNILLFYWIYIKKGRMQFL